MVQDLWLLQQLLTDRYLQRLCVQPARHHRLYDSKNYDVVQLQLFARVPSIYITRVYVFTLRVGSLNSVLRFAAQILLRNLSLQRSNSLAKSFASQLKFARGIFCLTAQILVCGTFHFATQFCSQNLSQRCSYSLAESFALQLKLARGIFRLDAQISSCIFRFAALISSHNLSLSSLNSLANRSLQRSN